ncbi:MAG TPA: hypothetical protein VHE37_16695, partial [Nevskiaceae bacterium]|nr:hypothetical protein [Nevskiaceae bacterium]
IASQETIADSTPAAELEPSAVDDLLTSRGRIPAGWYVSDDDNLELDYRLPRAAALQPALALGANLAELRRYAATR